MIVSVYIENEKLDLYKDESISLTSSVLDVQDITKNTTDFTKSFTVPASATNNKIFKHYYNANIENTFDARVKQTGRIELNGIPFKQGKILLNTVSVKSGTASSYNINFTGDLVKLKDLFGKDELKDLDLSAYDHDYNYTDVLNRFRSVSTSDYIYSLFAKRRFIYDSDPMDETNTEDLVNIAYNTPTQGNGIQWDELQPSLKVIRIIEAIETKYGITFSRDFFDTIEFTELYVWLNNTDSRETAQATATVNFDSGDDTYMDFATNIGTYNTQNNFFKYWRLFININPTSGFENIEYSIIMYDGDTIINQVDGVRGDGRVGQRIRDDQNTGNRDYLIRYEVVAEDQFEYEVTLEQYLYEGLIEEQSFLTYGSTQEIDRNIIISDVIPEIKVIDFIKGLFNAFKLVVIPTSDTEFYVNDVNSYYSEGDIIDITRYIDQKNVTVSRGKILNDINLIFQEPKTILNEQFEQNTGSAYGDEEVVIKDSNGEILEGESLDLELPFEQILYEKLSDQEDNAFTNVVYGGVFNREIKAVNPKMHLHYNIFNPIGSKTIAFRDTDGSILELKSSVNMPSHSVGSSDGTAFLFANEYSVYDGSVMVNNLYSKYHQNYISRLFNIKRRTFDIKLKDFPVGFLTKLSLNDLLIIKDDYYRINKYEVDLIKREVKLNLFNVFESGINNFNISDTYLRFSNGTLVQQLHVSNLSKNGYTALKTDLGFGTDWLTITDSADYLIFTLDVNDTGADRVMNVTITNNKNPNDVTIIGIEQVFGVITSDNSILTSDNNLITVDNG